MRLLAAAAALLAGCGGDGGSVGPPVCDTERRASFSGLPAGPLSESSIDGMRLFSLGGSVEVQHDTGQGLLVFVGGGAAFVPDCATDEVEVVFDGSQGPLTLRLWPSEYGGDLIVSASTNSLSLFPVDADWDRAVLGRDDGQPRVARADLSGGAVGDGVVSVALREIAFRPATD